LVRSFLDDVARSQLEARIVAYCDLENYAALRLLQTAGLRATLIDRDWTRFESIVPAPETLTPGRIITVHYDRS
jgi:hypothetical protein